jgi:hypothetical protein
VNLKSEFDLEEQDFSKCSFIPYLHKAKVEKSKTRTTSEEIKSSLADSKATDSLQTGGQRTNTTSVSVQGDELPPLEEVKEVKKVDPTRPVVVPTSGNVTFPSPIKRV